MEYHWVNQEPYSVAGISVVTENAGGKGARDIATLWQRFFGSAAGAEAMSRKRTVVGLYTDYEGDASAPYRFVAGYRIEPNENVPDPLQRFEVPGGTFARFKAEGAPERTVGALWGAVWRSGLRRQYGTDYESYRQYNAENPEKSVTELFIAVETPKQPIHKEE